MTLDWGTAIGDVASPFIQGLACAALQPGLRSVLVFDSSPQALRSAANVLTEMLKVMSEGAVKQVTLGRTDSEETLWGTLALKSLALGESFDWKPGLLGVGLKVVVIPDLTRLNLVAARACIALMGTEIVQVERHGHQAEWRSEICWIAGCARSEIGMVSPHLLDRFALRLPGQEIQSIDRTDALSAWFADLDAVPEGAAMLSPELSDRLRAAMLIRPTIAADAYERALAYFSDDVGMGMRRELALMRFAQARSQWSGIEQVSAREVDRTAQAMGLKLTALPSLPKPDRPELPPVEPTDPIETPTSIPTRSDFPKPNAEKPEVYRSDSEVTLPPTTLDSAGDREHPYPEDKAALQREFASLRLPPRRFQAAKGGRGAIIGRACDDSAGYCLGEYVTRSREISSLSARTIGSGSRGAIVGFATVSTGDRPGTTVDGGFGLHLSEGLSVAGECVALFAMGIC